MLETERLVLRKMESSDVDDLLRVFTDPKVMASFGGTLLNRAQMEQWVKRNLDHQERYGYGLFSVVHKDSGRLIGNCGLEHMELAGVMETELGYDLRSDVWNRGLATEAAMAVRDYAFATLGLPRLISLIRVGNKPSRRVAEKIGMTPMGETHRSGQRYWLYALESGARATVG